MLVRISKWLLALTLTLSLGVHWTVLQSLAWAGMIVSYSQDAPITEAITKTFDGKHPCGLCKVVEQGKATEKKPETQKSETKVDKFFVFGSALTLNSPDFQPLRFRTLRHLDPRTEAPPTPPPRSLPA